MQVLSVRQSDRIAQQKLLLIRQQALVAELYRGGQRDRARKAKDKLYQLLNALELLEEADQTGSSNRERPAVAQELPGQ